MHISADVFPNERLCAIKEPHFRAERGLQTEAEGAAAMQQIERTELAAELADAGRTSKLLAAGGIST